MAATRKITIDFETYLIAPGCNTPRPIVCAVLREMNGVVKQDLWTRWEHGAEILSALKEALENPDCLFIGHNIIFDFAVACAEWPELIPLVFQVLKEGRVWDNMIVELLYNMAHGEIDFRSAFGARIKSGYGLDDLAARWLGVRVEKKDTWRMRYAELDYVPLTEWPQEAKDYPLGDVLIPTRTQEAQQAAIRELVERDRMPDHEAQHRAAWWMYLMSTWGVRTNAQAVHALLTTIDAEMATLVGDLVASGVLKADLKRHREDSQVCC